MVIEKYTKGSPPETFKSLELSTDKSIKFRAFSNGYIEIHINSSNTKDKAKILSKGFTKV